MDQQKHDPGTIRVPGTLDDAGAQLAAIEGIVTARQWERAAIVYAFTTNNGPGRPAKNAANAAITCAEFAKLGIHGLRYRETVAAYRAAWQEAIDAGQARPVEPGDTIAAPDLPYPPADTGHSWFSDQDRRDAIAAEAQRRGMRTGGMAIGIAANTKSMQAAIAADPATAQAAAEALGQRERAQVARQAMADPDTADQALQAMPPEARAALVKQALADEDTAEQAAADPDTAEHMLGGFRRHNEREALDRPRPQPPEDRGHTVRDDFADAVLTAGALGKVRRLIRDEVEHLQGDSAQATLAGNEDYRDAVVAFAGWMRSAADMLVTVAGGGGASDEALAKLLDGEL